jgi:hypothetical protein
MRGLGFNHLRLKAEKLEREARELKELIDKVIKIEAASKAKPKEVPQGDKVQEVIAVYCEAWKDRYKSNPAITGKSVGIFKTLLKDFRGMRSKALIQAYLKMNDSFFIKKRHDPSTLSNNIQAISHFADSGAVVTKNDTREMERASKTKSLFDMVDKGTL